MISEIDKFLAPLLYRAQLLCGTTIAKDIAKKESPWKRNTGNTERNSTHSTRSTDSTE